MEINTKSFTLMLALLSFFHLSIVSGRKSINGFTLDLIHRDSPQSPYHDPSKTPFERLQKAFHRSFSRASFLGRKSVDSIESTLTPNKGEFLMKIAIGTPPIDTFVNADTGSDLTWTQCEPCYNCFKQLTPIFNPKNSSSYKTINCHNKLCQGLLCDNNTCNYEVRYGDRSHTMGDLSIETFTFASTSTQNVSIPNIVFGCGHNNGGTFSNATSGIFGLGGGNVSIVNQMHNEIKGKFSYCLIPLELLLDSSNATSHINFGDNAVVSGPDVISTPVYKKESPTFYYLNLKGVSIGNKTLGFISSPSSRPEYDRGNIIIDSGTMLTYVPDEFYSNLESLLIRSINATRKHGTYMGLDLCYESSENGTIDVPKIVAHFTNADLELSTSNIFSQVEEVSDSKDVNGFTLDFIHRDSPLSPHNDPSNTPFERVQKAFHRSFSRASFFRGKGVQSTLTPNEGEFLMKISIGTTPIDTFVIADTASDLTWTQLIYGDLSHTIGDLSIETFTFSSTSSQNISIPNIVFGCGHDNGGTFPNVTSGIIGLGGGHASIIVPMQLVTYAVVSGPDVISTPIYKKETPTFYYLNLKGVSIGNKTLEFKSSPTSQPEYDRGNIVIDSGTTLTCVPDEFYSNLESLLMLSINATRKDDPFRRLDLCYESNENGTIDVPKIVAHFTNADLELSTSNIFTKVVEGIVCLTIVPGGTNQISIIGYDLKANKLSFKPTDCTKH
nr:aspartic proteinase CDR1-like [Solanum lycopersicum]